MNSTESHSQAVTETQATDNNTKTPLPPSAQQESRALSKVESNVEFVILHSGAVVQIKVVQIKSGNADGTRPLSRGVSLRLTERDYDILHFLFDQKFASLETLYYRFFDRRGSVHELPPREFFVARQRLQLLKRGGLIHTQRVYSEAKSVYLLSKLGLSALQGKWPEIAYAPAIKEVDFRNYDHDRRVNLVRVALEREKKAWNWVSEREIRVKGYAPEGVPGALPESLVPDAIFQNSRGERLALEIEISTRKKSRFEEKIRAYSDLMDPYEPESALIRRVLFVACSDAVARELKGIIGKQEGFILERYEHFLSRLYSPGASASTSQASSSATATPSSGTSAKTKGKP